MPAQTQPAYLDPTDIVNPQTGGIWLDQGNIYTDGNGNLSVASINPSMGTGASAAVITGGTIAIPAGNNSIVRVNAAGAITGVIMPPGTRNGQTLILIITSAAANTFTFAAAGTSLVAGGAAVSLAGLAAHMFVWDSVASLWYQVGPLAN